MMLKAASCWPLLIRFARDREINMWVVLKYKNNELNFLKEDLKKKLGQQLKIYQPKIKLQRLIKTTKMRMEIAAKELRILCSPRSFIVNL